MLRQGSTDVGDVSYTVPTAGLRGATGPRNTCAQLASGSRGETSIGIKGMMTAAKVLSLTNATRKVRYHSGYSTRI